MKIIVLLTLLLFSFFWLAAQTKHTSRLVANGATPVLVSAEFTFTEGPAADSEGNVFFTDQPNDRIMKWSPGSGISLYMKGAGRSNGLYFDNEGNLISCADEKNELWLIDKNKNVTVLVTDFKGKKLNGPNDLWVDPSGGIYFTDPFYPRDYWTRTGQEITEQNVYYLSPDRKSLRMVMNGFVKPNGIIGTPDGKNLYVADIGSSKTYCFDISADGSLSGKRLFTEMGSDGMTIDSRGNIYLTGDGITVFNPEGTKIAHIPIDQPWTANVCFGGKDRRTLFITASTAVYTLKMKVRGVK